MPCVEHKRWWSRDVIPALREHLCHLPCVPARASFLDFPGFLYDTPVFIAAAKYPAGIVLVASSSNTTDSNGKLTAVNVANGSVIWSFNTSDANAPEGSYGLRFVPAIDPQCVPP